MPAGAAAGDERFQLLGLAQWRERGGRKHVAQILIDADRQDLVGDVHPARVGVFFILLLDPTRNIVLYLSQPRNRRTQHELLRRLPARPRPTNRARPPPTPPA